MHSQRVSLGVLLLKCCRDEEGVCLGVFVLPNLNADLWDSDTNLIQEPQQSVIIDCIWREKKLFILRSTVNMSIKYIL